MGFHEVQYPLALSVRSSGGPGFNTAINEGDDGGTWRVARWSGARMRYFPLARVRTWDQLAQVIEFIRCRNGAEHGFRFNDFLDHTTAPNFRDAPTHNDHEIGVGNGSATQFQLRKAYSDSAAVKWRNITKPVTGTVLVGIDGVNQASGWTVDTTTGVVTFTTPPAVDEVVTAGCEHDVPVFVSGEVDRLLNMSIDDYNAGSIAQLEFIEQRDGLETPDDFDPGGAEVLNISAHTVAAVGNGRVKNVVASTSGLKLIMPVSTNLPLGGPWFYILNDGIEDFDVVDEDTTTVLKVLAPTMDVAMVLESDGGGGKQWSARVAM